jgi:hypothetical protein
VAHVRVHPSDAHARDLLQLAEPARSGVAFHPSALAVEKDQALGPPVDGAVNRARDGRWHRGEDDPGALAEHANDSVTVLFAEVFDVDPVASHRQEMYALTEMRQPEVDPEAC